MRASLLFLLLLALPLRESRGQPDNVAVYERLALRCLAAAPDTLSAFRVDAAERMPYLRPALASAWQRAGATVYLADSLAFGASLPILRYRVEQAQVAYRRAGRRRVTRTLGLSLYTTITTPDGRLVYDRRCRETYADTLDRRALPGVEAPAFPETQGAHPEAGRWRRYVEPAVLTAAVAVLVLLFFAVRTGTEG